MDRLIAELEQKAAARVEEILAEAEAEAEAIAAEAGREVERVERVRLAERESEWRAAAARRVADVRIGAARTVLRARKGFLDRVFDRAAERIDRVDLPAAHVDAIGEWVERAFEYLGEAPASVVVSPGVEPGVRDRIPERPVDVEVDDSSPVGFVLRADDGSVRIDGTVRGALERDRDTLAIAVLERFERGGG